MNEPPLVTRITCWIRWSAPAGRDARQRSPARPDPGRCGAARRRRRSVHTLPINVDKTEPVRRVGPDRRCATDPRRLIRKAAQPGVGQDLPRRDAVPRPTRSRVRRHRRATRTPTPSPLASADRPRPRTRRRRGRGPPGPRDGQAWSSIDDSAPAGGANRLPGTQRHHCRQSRRSTGPAVIVNTSAPGTSISIRAGELGRVDSSSATVT